MWARRLAVVFSLGLPVVFSVVLSVGAQASDSMPAPVVHPAARMIAGARAGESWDVSARLDDGSHFFVRFWITNEGPGSHTGIAMGYFLRPDGRVAQFRYGRERDRWQLGARGRFLKVASAVLDLRAPAGAVEIDTNRGGMKIYLRFDIPEAPTPICARRGIDSGFDVLRLQEPVEGVAWVDGMTRPLAAVGTIDVTHTWAADSEIDTTLRRIDASGRQGDVAFFATTVAPTGDRNQAHSCVAIVSADANGAKKLYETQALETDVDAAPLPRTESSYPVPSRLVFRSEDLALTVVQRRELLRVDPLDAVPQPFRALLGLRSSPRRAWTEASWQLHLRATDDRVAHDLADRGLTATSYTNPP